MSTTVADSIVIAKIETVPLRIPFKAAAAQTQRPDCRTHRA
jgi:hypothetical protein